MIRFEATSASAGNARESVHHEELLHSKLSSRLFTHPIALQHRSYTSWPASGPGRLRSLFIDTCISPLPSLPAATMLRSSPLLRQLGARSTPRCHAAALTPLTSRCQSMQQARQQQTRKAHAISNPTLANIEKRWEGMPPQEQADLWMALRDRMKVDWNEMTLQEKKAGKSIPSY